MSDQGVVPSSSMSTVGCAYCGSGNIVCKALGSMICESCVDIIKHAYGTNVRNDHGLPTLSFVKLATLFPLWADTGENKRRCKRCGAIDCDLGYNPGCVGCGIRRCDVRDHFLWGALCPSCLVDKNAEFNNNTIGPMPTPPPTSVYVDGLVWVTSNEICTGNGSSLFIYIMPHCRIKTAVKAQVHIDTEYCTPVVVTAKGCDWAIEMGMYGEGDTINEAVFSFIAMLVDTHDDMAQSEAQLAPHLPKHLQFLRGIVGPMA